METTKYKQSVGTWIKKIFLVEKDGKIVEDGHIEFDSAKPKVYGGHIKDMKAWEARGNTIEPFETAEEKAARELKEFNDAKERKPKELKDECQKELKKGLIVLVGSSSYPDGFKIDSTREDATFLSAVYNDAILQNKTELVFRDYDNTSRLITMDEFKMLLSELSAHISKSLAKKWSLQDAVDSCKNIEEINAIVW